MIKIPFYPDTIPIVFSSNDYYVPYMSANMQSIMENANMDKKYCFFVLHRDISEEYMDLLKKQISVYNNFSIYFINVTEYFNGINFFLSGYVTIEAYFRLLIPYIFSEYHKVLYLDGDMICLTDISDLFNIDLGNNLLAAVRDELSRYYCPNCVKDMKSRHKVFYKLKDPTTYFNSGLILFNTLAFRNFISIEDLFKLAISREWYIHDQDILNFLSDGKKLILPYNWNFIFSTNAEYLPENLLSEYKAAINNQKIIHFCRKPLDSEYYIPFFEYFWKYATRTPFIDVMVKRMNDKGSISYEDFPERIIANITHRRGIGVRFILFDCIKAWLSRNKKSNKLYD